MHGQARQDVGRQAGRSYLSQGLAAVDAPAHPALPTHALQNNTALETLELNGNVIDYDGITALSEVRNERGRAEPGLACRWAGACCPVGSVHG